MDLGSDKSTSLRAGSFFPKTDVSNLSIAASSGFVVALLAALPPFPFRPFCFSSSAGEYLRHHLINYVVLLNIYARFLNE